MHFAIFSFQFHLAVFQIAKWMGKEITGASSSGKTRVFGTRIRRFESSRPSQKTWLKAGPIPGGGISPVEGRHRQAVADRPFAFLRTLTADDLVKSLRNDGSDCRGVRRTPIRGEHRSPLHARRANPMVGATRRVARYWAARRAAPTIRNAADGLFTKPSPLTRTLFRQERGQG